MIRIGLSLEESDMFWTSSRGVLRSAALTLVVLVLVTTRGTGQSGSISFVQQNYAAPQTPQTSVAVAYPAAQTAGDLNVVVVGWNDTTRQVASVTDTKGNVYVRAVGPTTQTGMATQSIYYAANVVAAAANGNTVTVTFTGAANYPDIRIAEYRGIAPVNPVDVTAAAQGSSTSSNSGPATTTNANDLLVGANLVQTVTTGPGASFTTRVITNPDGDILEDRIVTTTGSYSATAAVSSGQWIMQMVAFRGASGGGDTQPPTAPTNLVATPAAGTQINLSWTGSTDNVGVAGYRIERCQGSGCTTFVQVAAPVGTATTYSDTALTAATSYSYRVRATDAAGNLSGYSNSASATTPDTVAPTVPTNLAASPVSTNQISLSWTASTDNVSVTNYLVERCQGGGCSNFAQVGTSPTASFNDAGLVASTSYNYRVRATDAANNLSGYSNTASATTLAAPDTQPPSPPTNFVATAAGNKIVLSWTAATDNVGVAGYRIERCQGGGCTAFAQIAAPSGTGTTYNDAGLPSNTSYSYQVRAIDGAGNLGAYSSAASATTGDALPPTPPTNFAATASGNLINLSWTASTDDVGVNGYLLERCQGVGCSNFVAIPGPTGAVNAFSDPGLTVGATYSYRLRATDAAGNLSPYSNSASATILDTQAPTQPTNLAATPASGSQINLSWTASTDNVGVTGYRIERCQGTGCTTFVQIAAPAGAGTTYSDSGLASNTTYRYQVRGADAAGSLSAYSNVAGATTLAAPLGLVAAYSFNEGTGTTVADASGNNNAGTLQGATWTTAGKYGNALSFNGSTSYVDLGNPASLQLTGSMTWSAWVKAAVNPADDGQIIAKSNNNAGWQLKTSRDTGVQTFSVAVSSGNNSRTQRNSLTQRALNTWYYVAGAYDASARTLNIYVNGVLDNGLLTGTVPASQVNQNVNVNIGRRTGGTGFYFNGVIDEVRIYNRALSQAEVQADMNMPIGVVVLDTQPPTVPTNLVATPASSRQINLSWTASTDNVGVANYLIERCEGVGCADFLALATSSTRTFTDTDDLSASTSYSYRVRAADAAGNLSDYSATASATTDAPDTQAPTAPANLAATPTSPSQINLSWTASTDNVGVANYLIERCQGVGCSTFLQVGLSQTSAYSDTGLAPSTNYSYRVRAIDAASNLSGYSNVVNVTTLGASSGLVAAYSFNEGAGTTVADASGHGLTGTVQGATWVTGGRYGNALSFDGTTSFVDLGNPTALQLTGSMTLSAWVKAAANPADDGQIIAKSDNGSGWQLKSSPDTGPHTFGVSVTPAGTTTHTQRYSVTQRALGTWYYVSGVYDAAAGTLNIFVNGVLDSGVLTGAVPASQANSNVNVNIGRRTGGFYFNGMIDEVRIYNRALTGAEIQADMNAPVGGTADTQPPTTPVNLVATPTTGSLISLTWTASSDDVGVVNYLIERCQGSACSSFAPIGSSTAPSYGDAGLAASTSYSYRVRAADAAGNLSPYSNVATATTAMSLSPGVATLTPILTQQFTAGGGSITWLVDGVVGGSPASGTITPSGLYTPPPAAGVHTVTAISSTGQSAATVYVTTYAGTFTRDIDNLRTALNANETVLTPASVNAVQFGKLFSYALDGVSDASPLYVANVSIPGSGAHNVVYVATEHDSVYAFDADGRQSAPLWHRSFIDSANGITTVPPNDTGECCDIAPEIGITGSPVIDSSTNTLYVVAKTKEVTGGGGGNTKYYHRLHALDLATGAEKFGGPVVIQASVPGTGSGASGGQVTFNSLHENQRAALLLNNGTVYVAFAGHGDILPYHGWVLGYNAATLQQVMVFCTSPNDPGQRPGGGARGGGSGVWQSGDGLAADSNGDIFFVTGNGLFDANSGGIDFGDTLLRISRTGSVVDFFTPHDQQSMNDLDIDLGSGGVILLPDQPGPHPHMAITAGKNGTVYVVDRDNMGHYNPNNDNQIIQHLTNTFPNGTFYTGNFKAPAYWNGNLYFSADGDNVKNFQVVNGLLVQGWTTPLYCSYPGCTLGLSSNGNTNPILWAIQRVDLDPVGGGTRGPGSLHAFDAVSGNELYNSNQAAGSRDELDFTAKWAAPLVANGKVFVASNGQLTAFGLLPF
jgi:fibronectin type 3 domain-containing protein